jgi:cytochrome c-type biogenesis protein CcmH
VLWLIPPLALIGGGIALWFYNRRRNRAVLSGEGATFHLTPDEEARLEKLIADEESIKKPV